jgi:predicted transcriptional regulator
MIDFACKTFEISEVVKCSLSLSKSEFNLLDFFVKNSDSSFSTEELSTKLKLDKSTIQRGVKKLREKDLLFRLQINQTVGGYFFKYRLKDEKKLKRKLIDILDSWNEGVKKEVRRW